MDSQEVIACQVWFLTTVTGVGRLGVSLLKTAPTIYLNLIYLPIWALLLINMEVGRNFFFDQTG